MLSRDDVLRRVWALFLGVSVEKDGQVKGFSNYCNSNPGNENVVGRHAIAAFDRIDRGADPDETIAGAVMAVRRELEDRWVAPEEPRASADTVRKLVETIVAGLEPGTPKPTTALGIPREMLRGPVQIQALPLTAEEAAERDRQLEQARQIGEG